MKYELEKERLNIIISAINYLKKCADIERKMFHTTHREDSYIKAIQELENHKTFCTVMEIKAKILGDD